MSRALSRASCLVPVLIAVAVAAQPESSWAASVESGRAFVEENCAGCHAIGHEDESPLDQAPAFRSLHESYPVEHLAEALAEGIVTGHPDMPEFSLHPDQIDDLIAYLKSLED